MKTLYLVVDMQNDFVDGALGFDKASTVVDNIHTYLRENLTEQDSIIFTRDTHFSNYLDTQEGKKLPIIHCVKDTEGWQIVSKLQEFIQEDTLIFDKPTFGSLELGVYLQDKDFDTIEIMGLVSNICVISNAVIAKSALPEARIEVRRALTSSFDEMLDAKSMDVMAGFQIEIV